MMGLFPQPCSSKNRKYIQYFRVFRTFVWGKIHHHQLLPIESDVPYFCNTGRNDRAEVKDMLYTGDNLTGVKRSNRSVILHILHGSGSISRKRLAQMMRLTPAAVTKLVSEMVDENLIREGFPIHGEGAGRKEISLVINAHAYSALGMHINRESAFLSACWLNGSMIFCENIALPHDCSADEMLSQLSDRLMELVQEHCVPWKTIIGIGIAIRGITDSSRRISRNSFGVYREQNYPVADYIERRTGLKVIVSNNIQALSLAQLFFDREQPVRTQYFLRCEYGIGGALNIDNHPISGATGRCSEIGHIPVIRNNGKLCSCGKCGCLETVASPRAMIETATQLLSKDNTPLLWRLYTESGCKPLTIDLILEAARLGDSVIREMVDKAVDMLTMALKTVLYAVNLEQVILYGSLFENSFYLKKFLLAMEEGLNGEFNDTVIRKSAFNTPLEEQCACILMIDWFFSQGGIME